MSHKQRHIGVHERHPILKVPWKLILIELNFMHFYVLVKFYFA